jgi:hypothetical protein
MPEYMIYPLWCVNCAKVEHHHIEQVEGGMFCSRCGLRFGSRRQVVRRHPLNKPKPRDYEGHKVALRKDLRDKPREKIKIIT